MPRSRDAPDCLQPGLGAPHHEHAASPLLAGELRDNTDHLRHGLLQRGKVVGIAQAVERKLFEQLDAERVRCGTQRCDLIHDLVASTLVIDHPLYAARLAFNRLEALQNLVADRGIEISNGSRHDSPALP
jgi:hypothetical protein